MLRAPRGKCWGIAICSFHIYPNPASPIDCLAQIFQGSLSQYCMERFASASNRDSLGRLDCRKFRATPTVCSCSSNWICIHKLRWWVYIILSNKSIMTSLYATFEQISSAPGLSDRFPFGPKVASKHHYMFMFLDLNLHPSISLNRHAAVKSDLDRKFKPISRRSSLF